MPDFLDAEAVVVEGLATVALELAARAFGFDGSTPVAPGTIRLIDLRPGADEAGGIVAMGGVAARNAARKVDSLAVLGNILADERRALVLEPTRARTRRLLGEGRGESEATTFPAEPVALDTVVCPRCRATSAATDEEIGARFGWRLMTDRRKDGAIRTRRVRQSHCRKCRNKRVTGAAA